MARALAAVFAHPDDETFSLGGTLARYAAEGVRCDLFCATDGGAGRASGVPVSSPEELAALRREELITAARILGVDELRLPGHPDGRLGAVDADLLVGEVVAFLRERRPQVVVTFGPEGARNAHRDHRAISRAATAAFFLAGLETAYPEQLGERRRPHAPGRLWYVTWKTPPPDAELKVHGLPIAAQVDVGAYLATKRAAFEAHRTQRDHRRRFETVALASAEAFAFAAGAPLQTTPADDLFAGL